MGSFDTSLQKRHKSPLHPEIRRRATQHQIPMELPYFDNPAELHQRLAPLGDAALLDSGDSERGRWDIAAAGAEPESSLVLTSDAPWPETQRALDVWLDGLKAPIAENTDPTLPFDGGYVGFFSYELGRRLQGLPDRRTDMPLACVRHYPWAVVQDRQARQSRLVGTYDQTLADKVLKALGGEAPESLPFRLLSAFERPWSEAQFADTLSAVKNYLLAGDCYQINIGQPFSAEFEGDLADAYGRLRSVAGAPFSAFLSLDDHHALISLSPERFITVNGRIVETRPIKGTRPRHLDPEKDGEAMRELITSDKERAENLMIVDLLRNDIGRYCEAGSVSVDELFRVETYRTVHHLVSVVRGNLKHGVHPMELLVGSLPGGSITGAPKRRAMEIIDELEPGGRDVWCGTIFYLSRNGRLDSNIAIRTLFNTGSILHCWAGGGLVYDSEADAEYQEQQHKVGAFIETLEKDLR
ncbi:MAG: aminodeoxychorismate synthase component I [Pseudomonadota bacterium]